MVCSQAGDTTFTGHLGAFAGAVLAIEADLGFGALLEDVFPLMPGADITLLQDPNFGHVDFQVNPDHEEILDKPITQWLKHDVTQDEPPSEPALASARAFGRGSRDFKATRLRAR